MAIDSIGAGLIMEFSRSSHAPKWWGHLPASSANWIRLTIESTAAGMSSRLGFLGGLLASGGARAGEMDLRGPMNRRYPALDEQQ